MPTQPRYLTALIAFAAVMLVLSNILAAKLIRVFGLTINGGTAVYPLVFWIGDVLTEVYGYATARRAIWIAFGCQLVALAGIELTLRLPAAFPAQAAPLEQALSLSGWIVAGSLLGYLCGDFVNAAVLSLLKRATRRRWLFTRTIASTVSGQAMDTGIFVLIAFGIGARLPLATLWSLLWGVYVAKVAIETLLTPVVYVLVTALKRAESRDPIDIGISYSPLAVAES